MTKTPRHHILSRRAIAPVFKSTDIQTTGAIAHRLSCGQEIDAELDELSGEIMEMLQEVHS